MRAIADYVIDTSKMSCSQLKEQISDIFTEKNTAMAINVMSFGFKHGTPTDVDLVFDVRCLPNPFYIEELKNHRGTDKPVSDYVFGNEEAKGLLKHIISLLEYSLPLYLKEGKSRLVIAVGCTGGHHRSVAFCEEIAKQLKENYHGLTVTHRDIER